MIKAALKEIQTAPIATLGAIAGIASFVFVLVSGASSAAPAPTGTSQVAAALAFVKLALVVPGTAFFFAHVATLFLMRGSIRGAFVSAILFLVAEAFGAAAAGVILSPFTVQTETNTYGVASHFVLGINLASISFTTFVANVFIFVGVIGEALYLKATAPKPKGRRQQTTEITEDAGAFLLAASLYVVGGSSLFAAFFVHAVLRGSIGAF